MLITSVDPGSPASIANLQKGDVILEANHEPVSSVGELQRALGKAQDQVLLLVKHQGSNMYVVIQMK